MAAASNAPDIISLTETKLAPAVNDSELAMPNYDLFRLDRNIHGSGIAIYAHSDLAAELLKLDVKFKIEALTTRVKFRLRSCVISCIYRSPSSKASWETFFHSFLDLLTRDSSPLVITGNFNHYLLKNTVFADNLDKCYSLK